MQQGKTKKLDKNEKHSLYLNAFLSNPDSLLGGSRTEVLFTDDWQLYTRAHPRSSIWGYLILKQKVHEMHIKKMKCIFLKNCKSSCHMFSASQVG